MINKAPYQKTLFLGIGNILLSDEGAGVHALNLCKSYYGHLQGVKFLDGGTLSFSLAGEIESASSLIVFDAAQLNQPAGSVCCLEGKMLDEFLSKHGRSVHEVGLMDLMDIARLAERLPRQRALIGIQPYRLTWGESVSEPLRPALKEAARIAFKLLQIWHKANTSAECRKHRLGSDGSTIGFEA